eukprot:m.288205 g.288205  ORF g.288205 m.288205 type:complete len:184 (-) comp19956_c0_seq8:1858-2409(-)
MELSQWYLVQIKLRECRLAVPKSSASQGYFNPERVVTTRGGRGGNFAFGFHGRRTVNVSQKSRCWHPLSGTYTEVGDAISSRTAARAQNTPLLDAAIDAIRLEAERCTPVSFVIVHSLAGGTGSGLGARIIQELRAEFPARFILSVTVAPFTSGENPMQVRTVETTDAVHDILSCVPANRSEN